ncbi:MAG: hypothetical protein HY720_07795 [Planctomycetes bacterium]|nr:hypothetical protein [Planctomycetota bacterium]
MSEQDPHPDEAAVERYARAFLRPSLFERLRSLKGATLGGWTAVWVRAIGSAGVLLEARKGEARAVLKMPHLPYDRPATFGAAEIRARREALLREAEMLRRFSDSPLPSLIELVTGENPLLAERSAALRGGEVYLAMEPIAGRAIDLEVQARLRHPEFNQVGEWLGRWIEDVLSFLKHLRRTPPGHYYTDFKPSQVLVAAEGQIRIVDAGGIARAGLEMRAPVTRAYAPGTGDLEPVSLQALGRTLYAALLNKVLHERSGIDEPLLATVCPADLAHWISKAAQGAWSTIDEAIARLPL